MTTIYYGYGDMPLNKIETLPYIDLEQAKTELKIFTNFNPITILKKDLVIQELKITK